MSCEATDIPISRLWMNTQQQMLRTIFDNVDFGTLRTVIPGWFEELVPAVATD